MTGTTNDTGWRSFQATAAAMNAGTRVTVDSDGKISAANAAVAGIGVTTADVAANGNAKVKLWSAPGTFAVIANAAITAGNEIYPTASGRVDDAIESNGLPLGLVALENASGQHSVIEVAPRGFRGLPVGDGSNLVLGTSTGTKVGTNAAQKLGFWAATPIVQPSGANQAVVTATIAAAAATATNSAAGEAWGANSSAAFTAMVTALANARTDINNLTNGHNELRNSLVNSGLVKGSA